MSITKLLPRLPSLLLLALATSALFESGGAAVLPSQSDKVIDSGNIRLRSDPLEVVSITADEKSVKFKEKFTAAEERFQKEIIFIHCDFDFPKNLPHRYNDGVPDIQRPLAWD